MAKIEVLQPGLFSSIQDLGRFGFQKYGVPQSGVMDRYAMRICNLILGNDQNNAVLEITMQGPKLQFSESALICISGADLSASLNEKVIPMNTAVKVTAGNVLKFGMRKSGSRSYLGIKNGWQCETIMNSRSWYDEITEHTRLNKGMFIDFESCDSNRNQTGTSVKIDHDYLYFKHCEVYPGPEFQLLSKDQQKILFEMEFTVEGNSNRMAIQFQQNFENTLKPIITSPVLPGTVQLTPSGKLIVLMRDCQTTGGYPRVLQLSEYGIQMLSQKLPGEKIKFQKKEYPQFG